MKKIISFLGCSYLMFLTHLSAVFSNEESASTLKSPPKAIHNIQELTLHALDVQFQVIDTDIEGDSLHAKLEKAKVIFLLESHQEGGGQKENADLINQEWQQGIDLLFTEAKDTKESLGSLSTTSRLLPEIAQTSQSWDIETLPYSKEAFNIYLRSVETAQFLITALYLGAVAKPNDVLSHELSEDDKKYIDFFTSTSQRILQMEAAFKGKNVDRVIAKDPTNLSIKERFNYLYSLIPIVQFNMLYAKQLFVQSVTHSFYKRNKNMVNSIIDNLKTSPNRRLWLIAGEWHAQYALEENKEGVSYLYDHLKAENIPYITLKYRKESGQFSKRELDNRSLNDSQDSQWNVQETKLASQALATSYQEQFTNETSTFTTASMWGKWMITNIIKVNNLQMSKADVATVVKWALQMDALLNFCFEQIVEHHVLEE